MVGRGIRGGGGGGALSGGFEYSKEIADVGDCGLGAGGVYGAGSLRDLRGFRQIRGRRLGEVLRFKGWYRASKWVVDGR